MNLKLKVGSEDQKVITFGRKRSDSRENFQTYQFVEFSWISSYRVDLERKQKQDRRLPPAYFAPSQFGRSSFLEKKHFLHHIF